METQPAEQNIFEKISNERYYLAVVFFVAAAMILPVIFFGIPDTNDLSQHFKFAQTYYASIIDGDFFPGWSEKDNFGYGDAGIRFYPPLAYYVLALARIFVGNWFDATWLTFMFWMILGCCGIFYWARCWLSIRESAVAACFYAVIPFHLHQLYISYNNYSEFAAASILVFCFAFVTKIFQREKIQDVLGLAVFSALLILTHLPLTIIGIFCLFAYALTLLKRENFLRPLVKFLVGIGFGLLGSAFYWVGLVSEMKWLNHVSDKFNAGNLSYESNFFPFYYHTPLTSLKYAYFMVDISAAITFLFLSSAVVFLIYKRRDKTETNPARNVFKTVLPLGILAFFMVTFLSRPIWQIVTPLQKVQFPMRWMTVVSICGAVVAGAGAHYLLKGGFLKQRIWAYGSFLTLTAILLFNLIYILNPAAYVPLSREKFEAKVNDLPEAVSYECWWTVWAQPKALETKEKVSIQSRETNIISWKAEERVFEISEGAGGAARIGTFFYPHWQATINNKSVSLEKDENGAMLIPISNEKSLVRVYFQEPLQVRAASIFSLLTWLLFGGFSLFFLSKKLFLFDWNAHKREESLAINS